MAMRFTLTHLLAFLLGALVVWGVHINRTLDLERAHLRDTEERLAAHEDTAAKLGEALKHIEELHEAVRRVEKARAAGAE